MASPGSSVHGMSQARIHEWVATSCSRRSSPPRDWTCVSCIDRRVLYPWRPLGRILLYFFGVFFFFSWRLITLQYCTGFCHTLIWICLLWVGVRSGQDRYLHRWWSFAYPRIQVWAPSLGGSGTCMNTQCMCVPHPETPCHTNCEIICSSSVKNTIGSLIGIALNL